MNKQSKEMDELDELLKPPKFAKEFEGKDCFVCGHPMPNSRGMKLLKQFINDNFTPNSQCISKEEVMKNVDELYTEFEKDLPPSSFDKWENNWNDGFYKGKLKAMEGVVRKLFNMNGDKLSKLLSKPNKDTKSQVSKYSEEDVNKLVRDITSVPVTKSKTRRLIKEFLIN